MKNRYLTMLWVMTLILVLAGGARAQETEPTAGIPEEGLVAYYPFSGNLEDASGTGHHLTASRAVFAADRFLAAGQALAFNGDYNASPADEAHFILTNAFSVACWFKTGVSKGTTYKGNYALFPNHAGQGAGIGAKVGTDGIDVLEHGDNHIPTQFQYNGTIGTGWNHLCLVVPDRTSLIVYLNGECIGTATLSTREKYFRLVVGGLSYGYYTGKIDELYVYDRGLTAEEVTQIHEAGLTSGDSDGDGLSDGWERGVGRYEIIAWTNGWTAAKADAEARGGHLATIMSEAEWMVISNMFGTDVLRCWLGGTDAEEEGTWKWVTGEPWDYSRWHSGEPNNSGGAQNYLAFEAGYGTLWDDKGDGDGTMTKYLLEIGYYTDPLNADTDGDGVPDGEEYELGRNPVIDEAKGTANEVVSVECRQRWPWNGLVDIDYEISGLGTNEEELVVALRATATIGQQTVGLQTLSGEVTATAGRHRMTWDSAEDWGGEGVAEANIGLEIVSPYLPAGTQASGESGVFTLDGRAGRSELPGMLLTEVEGIMWGTTWENAGEGARAVVSEEGTELWSEEGEGAGSWTPQTTGLRELTHEVWGDGVQIGETLRATFDIAKKSQTVEFDEVGEQWSTNTVVLSATASSGLDVSFEVVSGPGVVEGNALTFTAAGDVVVAAVQAGDEVWAEARATQTVAVVHAVQSIDFPPIALQWTGDIVELAATASGGGSVSFEVVSGPGVITDGMLSFMGAGKVVVAAIQDGDEMWTNARSEQTVEVIKEGILSIDPTEAIVSPAGASESVSVHVTEGANWIAEPMDEWLSIPDGAEGTGDGSVTYCAEANPGEEERTGQIRFFSPASTPENEGDSGRMIWFEANAVDFCTGNRTISPAFPVAFDGTFAKTLSGEAIPQLQKNAFTLRAHFKLGELYTINRIMTVFGHSLYVNDENTIVFDGHLGATALVDNAEYWVTVAQDAEKVVRVTLMNSSGTGTDEIYYTTDEFYMILRRDRRRWIRRFNWDMVRCRVSAI